MGDTLVSLVTLSGRISVRGGEEVPSQDGDGGTVAILAPRNSKVCSDARQVRRSHKPCGLRMDRHIVTCGCAKKRPERAQGPC